MFSKSNFVYSKSKSSYSNLLNELDSGNIESLFLYPKRREVDVLFKNGVREKVPIFYNDQIILEKAANNKVELTIN